MGGFFILRTDQAIWVTHFNNDTFFCALTEAGLWVKKKSKILRERPAGVRFNESLVL